jgi:hypothetical protein
MDELVPELLSFLFSEGKELIANAMTWLIYFSIIALTNLNKIISEL